MNTGYSVCILCGGRSVRMGRDKAMLDWKGKHLLLHIAEGFRSCDDLFLSVRDGSQYEEIAKEHALPGVFDSVHEKGPLAGLCASLYAAKHDILFITTCDAPLADSRTADLLTAQLKEHDCVVPVSENGRVHPLIAVYRKSVLEKAGKHLENDDLKMLSLLSDLDVLYYPGENLPHGNLTLSNLNTPDDAKALARLL